MSHKRYLRNYSPITYQKDDEPALFAAVSRSGMRMPTFAEPRIDAQPTYRMEARDIHAVMDRHDVVGAHEVHTEALPPRPKHAHSVSPWFALASGMVVAGALVMALVAVTPESMLPKGTIAKVVERALTATVIFSH